MLILHQDLKPNTNYCYRHFRLCPVAICCLTCMQVKCMHFCFATGKQGIEDATGLILKGMCETMSHLILIIFVNDRVNLVLCK